MSAEEFMREPPKNRARQLVAYLAIAAVMFGAGMLLESHLAGQTAASAKLGHEQELKQVAEKAEQDKRMLTDTLTKEREEHAPSAESSTASEKLPGSLKTLDEKINNLKKITSPSPTK